MGYCEFLFALFLCFNCFPTYLADITINGVKCGQKKCSIGEYCSNFNNICEPCASICTSSHHNFDENECTKNCQDYLHDIKFHQRNGTTGISDKSLEKLKGEVQKLSQMITVTLAIVCFMFVILAAVLFFQLYRWKKKKNITLQQIKAMLFKKSEGAGDVRMDNSSNRKENSEHIKPELRLDISNISTVSEHSPVTALSTISTRRPAEDSALDYAYDNHAMSASPK